MNYSASYSMMISLPDLYVLEITGVDAVSFAHAQFSSDVRSLADGQWQWSAWLSPQGRVHAFFQLLRDSEERLRVLLRGGDAQTLRGELARYVLRAKVALGVSDARVCASGLPATQALELPGSPPRWLVVADPVDAADESPEARERWRLADIRAGLPTLAENLRDQLLPQWLGLDRLGAVSVAKGCYPGQEVMSRLHFKGGNKRSLYRIELAGTSAPGTALKLADDTTAGLIVMSARRDDGRAEALASLTDASAAAPLHTVDTTPGETGVLERFA
jgi:folate-binding protein YgfZ